MTLAEIAGGLREEATVISEHVVEPTDAPVLGAYVALGPRCRAAPSEYALVIESIREGYLLHYGEPRLVAGADSDLALLAGDHLYALGLERLAALGDLEAVRELADLISLCALIAAEGRPEEATALWLASATAIAAGGTTEHEAAKAALRQGDPAAPSLLRATAQAAAATAGLAGALAQAAEAIESAADVSA